MRSSGADRIDYTGVTETPGTRISREAASMAVSRYEVVRRLARGRRVLEVACGSGQGLGYVARDAAWLVGGDITAGLLARARDHYGGRVPLVRFDAHALPFAAGAFDLVELHEAIYYMAEPSRVFQECHRVLGDNGVLVISSINPRWPDFNPSLHSARYLDAAALKAALADVFQTIQVSFGFPVRPPGRVGSVVSVLKRTAVRFSLIPSTMKGKSLLKRVFLGPLVYVPAELEPGLAAVDEPVAAPASEDASFRIIYAVARK